MRRGDRSRATRDAADLAEHRRIKGNGSDRAPAPNEAQRWGSRLLTPSDPRWEMQPPYGWVEKHPGESYSSGLTSTRCWYCTENVTLSEKHLYSKRLSMLSHIECYGSGDTTAQKRATVDST